MHPEGSEAHADAKSPVSPAAPEAVVVEKAAAAAETAVAAAGRGCSYGPGSWTLGRAAGLATGFKGAVEAPECSISPTRKRVSRLCRTGTAAATLEESAAEDVDKGREDDGAAAGDAPEKDGTEPPPGGGAPEEMAGGADAERPVDGRCREGRARRRKDIEGSMLSTGRAQRRGAACYELHHCPTSCSRNKHLKLCLCPNLHL